MANLIKPPCDEAIIRSAPDTAPSTEAVGRWVLVVTILGSSMAFIDGTAVNVALPVLQKSLNATVADVQWMVEAYALFLASLILVGGTLGDHFGRRRIFAIGVALFTLASVSCGLAQNSTQLIFARAIQGIGGALLLPGSLAIISTTFSNKQTSPCCWERVPTPSLFGFSRPFVAFLGGSLVSRIGDALYTFALPWMAYELTHSSLVLGTLYATEILPVLLFGAFAGVYVDRLNRRHLLLGADMLRATLVALLPLLSLLGLLQLWELYALAFSLALLSLASDVATTAVLPKLSQSENTRANAAYQFIMQAAEFAGPALAGLAIAALGGVHTLWLDALSFGGTFLVIWRVPNFPGQTSSQRDRHVLSELREGLHWLRKEPVIKWLGLQAMLGNLGLGMVSAVFLYYLRTQLRLPAQLAGLEYAMIGVGGLLGSLLIVPLTRLLRRGTLYPVLLSCGLIGRASMVVLPWWWVPGVSLGLVAACDTAWIILSTSVRQERIPAQLMGRVLSFSRLLSTAAMPLGAIIGGLMAQTFDPRLVFGMAALTKGGEVLIARFSAIHRL